MMLTKWNIIIDKLKHFKHVWLKCKIFIHVIIILDSYTSSSLLLYRGVDFQSNQLNTNIYLIIIIILFLFQNSSILHYALKQTLHRVFLRLLMISSISYAYQSVSQFVLDRSLVL